MRTSFGDGRGDNAAVWRGEAQPAFGAQLGQSLSLARGEQPASAIREVWVTRDGELSVLFGDRNGNGIVDADDLRIEFVGAPQLDSRVFGTSFGVTLGSAGGDSLVGSSAADEVYLGAGHDVAQGLDGNDTLHGETGRDTLQGGQGDDSLEGGSSSDLLQGGDGVDHLDGGSGADTLEGGDGNDYLRSTGTSGIPGTRDWMDGGAGNDQLTGGADPSTLIGGVGNDLLTAGSRRLHGPSDDLSGGDGDDGLVAGSGYANASMRGGRGADTFSLSVNSAWVMPYHYEGWDTVSYPFEVRIRDFDAAQGDRISLSLSDWEVKPALVWRGAAASAFQALEGQSLALAGVTPDPRFMEVWTLNRDQQTLVFIDSNRNGVVDASDFRVALDGQPLLERSLFLGLSSRRAGSDGDDGPAALPPTAARDAIHGLAGNDTLAGAGGGDWLYGDDGDDRLAGDDGLDQLDGGAGDDFIDGGAGDDSLDGGTGADTLEGGGGNDVMHAARGWFDGSAIQESAGSRNVLRGGAGNDSLWAAAGDDLLEGGEGDDTLIASAGQDTLIGGAGADSLGQSSDPSLGGLWTGGEGADRFLVAGSSVAAQRRITDFDAAQGDRLNLGSGNGSVDYVWRGEAPLDYRLQVGAPAPGAAATLGLETVPPKDRPWVGYESSVLELWTVHDHEQAQTLLYGDRNRNGLVDADDLLLRFDGLITLGIDSFVSHDDLFSEPRHLGGAAADSFTGAASADLFYGGGGNDSLAGHGGNDELLGGAEDDSLEGGDGQDSLHGGSAEDRLMGGAGDDLLLGGLGADWLDGGAGNDVLDGCTQVFYDPQALEDVAADTLMGGGGNDQLVFSAGAGLLDGGADTDIVSFRAYDHGVQVDLRRQDEQAIAAGERVTLLGLENVEGSYRADWLHGDAGNNLLNGSWGDDSLIGGAGVDTLSGGAGDDVYWLGSDQDLVWESGGEGIDTVHVERTYTLPEHVEIAVLGGSGHFSLYGNLGDNLLVANAGNNTLWGGREGHDTASYAQAAAAVQVDLRIAGAQATGGSGTDTLSLIESLIGSAFADRLTGNALGNTLDGGTGADTLEGGDGDDVYVIDSLQDLIVEAGSGKDWVHSHLSSYGLGATLENGVILHAGVANLYGNAADNLIVAGAGDNRIYGGGGNDTVSYERAASAVAVDLSIGVAQPTGGSGHDALVLVENLIGGAHNDVLTGSSGWNRLDGGVGADTMAGGLGSDRYVVDHLGDVVIEAEAPPSAGNVDWVETNLVDYTLPAGVENLLVMHDGVGYIRTLNGNALNNLFLIRGETAIYDMRLNGGAGFDVLSYEHLETAVTGHVNGQLVMAGFNSYRDGHYPTQIEGLIGSKAGDVLYGDQAANELRGAAGADTLYGGDGNDLLFGGRWTEGDGAADHFVFGTGPDGRHNVDRIFGFEADALDKIVLDPGVFASLDGGWQDGHFRAGAGVNAQDEDDFILFDTATGNLWYDADGSGAGAKVLFAKLMNWTGSVDASDFLLSPPSGG